MFLRWKYQVLESCLEYVCKLSGGDLDDIKMVSGVGLKYYWHERSALQLVAVRWSTINKVIGYYFCRYFLSPPPCFFYQGQLQLKLG